MKNLFRYRDYFAEQQVLDAYRIGSEYNEPAFVDASKLRGGVLSGCNLRYLILSNRGADLGLLNDNARKFGLVVFPRGQTWKILDKYTENDATQILLSPDTVKDSSLQQLITIARKDFTELCEAAPVNSLDTEEWKNRLFFPIGLTDENLKNLAVLH